MQLCWESALQERELGRLGTAMVPSQEMSIYRLQGEEGHMRRKANCTKAIGSLSDEPPSTLSCIQEKIHRLGHDSREKSQGVLTLCRQGVSWRTLPALSTTALDLWAEDIYSVHLWGDYWNGQDTLCDMPKISLDNCLWSKGLSIMPLTLTQGSGGPSTTFYPTISVSSHPRSMAQGIPLQQLIRYALSMMMRDCVNIEQLSERELNPSQPWTTTQHNHGACRKFYELVKALFCPQSGRSASCCQDNILHMPVL